MVAAIVEAATRILAAEGFDRMNVNRVAELAGVSIGSLYQYYPSKEALVGAVADRLGNDTAALVAGRMSGLESLAPREAIRCAVECVIAAYRLNPTLRRVIRDEVPEAVPHFATPEIDAQLRRAILVYLETHRELLRPDDLDLALTVVFTSVEAVCARTADHDGDAVAAEVASMVERYLLADG